MEKENSDSCVNEAPAAGGGVYGGQTVYSFEFRGSAGEYFKIWIVNLLLTIVTVGIFSAWAKVRNRRYFYGYTFVDGANFEYHASPWAILISRIIVLFLFVGGTYWAGEDLFRQSVHSLLLALFLPWAFVRGLSFNARNSSYRNVRFAYDKHNRVYLRAYLIYLPFIIALLLQYLYALGVRFVDVQLLVFGRLLDDGELTVFSAALSMLIVVLLLPVVLRAYQRLTAVYHRWGRLQFGFAPRAIGFYMIACWFVPLVGVLVVAGGFAAVLYVVGVYVDFDAAKAGGIFTSGLALLAVYVMFAVAIAFVLVQLFRLFWESLVLPGDGRVRCNFGMFAFAVKIIVVNYFAIIFSLGLLYPWAKVRKTRFLAENMQLVLPAGTMDGVLADAAGGEAALGEEFEAVQGFDIDVGLI